MADGGINLPILSWLDEPIKKSVNEVFQGINTKIEALDLFNSYRKTHFAMLTEAVGKVKVLGMSAPLDLLDLYYPTQVSSDIRRRLYQSEWVTQQKSKKKRTTNVNSFRPIDGASYVEKSNRLVVLGGPGAGKTTFLKYLSLAYSVKKVFGVSKLKTSKLPFFVALPELAKTDDEVFDFMSKHLVVREGDYAKEFIKRSLDKGLSIVLLDSLDEVSESKRSSVVERVKRFAALYPDVKMVISCRTADYKEVLDSFDEVELVKLSRDAVRKIIGCWFAKDEDSANQLIEVIENDVGISNLTETPLLLSLLCIQFRHDLVLPRRKVEIYKRCVEALLRDWDTTRGFRRSSAYESLSDDHKERLFEHIAGQSLIDDQSYVVPADRLYDLTSEYIVRLGLDVGESKNVITEIESHHGIIEKHSMDSFCFSHASIHDYFVARYALSRRTELDVLKNHLEDESWAGVIEFMCGLHAEPQALFDVMARKATLGNLKNYPAIERRAKLLFLMYRCLTVGPVLDPKNAEKIYGHILSSIAGFSQLMAQSGVYAMCAYNIGGVRHPYLLLNSKRPSLHSALLPFRKLSNEILARPVQGYVDAALECCDRLIDTDKFGFMECSTTLNTLVPLARATPGEVLIRLERIRGRFGLAWIDMIIDESVTTIEGRAAR